MAPDALRADHKSLKHCEIGTNLEGNGGCWDGEGTCLRVDETSGDRGTTVTTFLQSFGKKAETKGVTTFLKLIISARMPEIIDLKVKASGKTKGVTCSLKLRLFFL